jgi:hypothetical protein
MIFPHTLEKIHIRALMLINRNRITKDMTRHFLKQGMLMAKKHMTGCSTPVVIMKTQSNTNTSLLGYLKPSR